MCSFKVRNNTDQPATAGKYKYYVNKRNQVGGNWELAFSAFLPAIGAKQAISHTTHAQLSLLDKEVQIVIHEGNNSTKPIITQATGTTNMPPVNTVQIESAQADVNSWQVVVRNNSQYYLWDITVQASMGTGGNWKPVGGSSIAAIPPGSSEQCGMPRPAGWKTGYSHFKVALYQGSDLITHQIYPL